MGRAQELGAATVDGVKRTALAMISCLWAPAVVRWAAQHAELAQQKFVTTFLLAAVAAAATFTWYVCAVWGWPGMKSMACMVHDRPHKAVGVLHLALSVVYAEGLLCQEPLLLSMLDSLQLLLVRWPLVRPSMKWTPWWDRVRSRPVRAKGVKGVAQCSPSPYAYVVGAKWRTSACWVASTVVWLSTKAVFLLLVWALHVWVDHHLGTGPTAAVHDVAPEQVTNGSAYLQMLQTHLWFAFAALSVCGLLPFVPPLSLLLFDAISRQHLLEAVGDCVLWCHAVVTRTAAGVGSGWGWWPSFSRARGSRPSGWTWLLGLFHLPLRDEVLWVASSCPAYVCVVRNWIVQSQNAAAAGVSRGVAAVCQSWQQRLRVLASTTGSRSRRDAAVVATTPGASSSSGAQPSACRAAHAVSQQPEDCIVCFEARRTVALLPCGHVALCAGCLKHLQRQAKAAGSVLCCPLCRAEVKRHVGGLVVV